MGKVYKKIQLVERHLSKLHTCLELGPLGLCLDDKDLLHSSFLYLHTYSLLYQAKAAALTHFVGVSVAKTRDYSRSERFMAFNFR